MLVMLEKPPYNAYDLDHIKVSIEDEIGLQYYVVLQCLIQKNMAAYSPMLNIMPSEIGTHHWYELGLQLGLEANNLLAIEQQFSGDT